MKLSEAIRLGAMLRPQCRWGFLEKYSSCALGAATEANGLSKLGQLRERYPILATWAPLPVDAAFGFLGFLRYAKGYINELEFQIITLNMIWTRERIADWVESIEPQEESDASRLGCCHENGPAPGHQAHVETVSGIDAARI